jgi:ribosome-associated protein
VHSHFLFAFSPGCGIISMTILQGGVSLEPTELAKKIVDIAADKKAEDVVLLDIRRLTTIADYFVICSGTSERQVAAITQAVLEELDKENVTPLHSEGVGESGWVLLDYGSVIVHIFVPEVRDYYRLERLWSQALTVVRIQ